jgi:hypothetical protein
MTIRNWFVVAAFACALAPSATGCMVELEDTEELDEDDAESDEVDSDEDIEPAAPAAAPATSGSGKGNTEFTVTGYAENWDVRKLD